MANTSAVDEWEKSLTILDIPEVVETWQDSSFSTHNDVLKHLSTKMYRKLLRTAEIVFSTRERPTVENLTELAAWLIYLRALQPQRYYKTSVVLFPADALDVPANISSITLEQGRAVVASADITQDCRESADGTSHAHCLGIAHAQSLADGVAMLRRQLDSRKPAHGNGYALCMNTDEFEFDIGYMSGMFTSKDDGFCCFGGNYTCWEKARDARRVLNYNAAILRKATSH